jgi:glycosyltransferase involved in cell wall biosynthesis
MVELALAWSASGRVCWFVTPRPRTPFRSAGSNATVDSLLRAGDTCSTLHVARPDVGAEFEFGTDSYRSTIYERAVVESVPIGVPILPSDDTAAWRACERLADRNPIVLVSHGDYASLYERLASLGQRAAAIVAISGRVDQRIRELTLPESCMIARIPLGVALGSAPSDMPLSASGRFHLAWVGRMDEESKRVSDLPKIADELRSRGFQFMLSLIGDGPSRTMLERLVRDCSLTDHIRFVGWQRSPDVRRLLSESEALLLPSNREGMPVSMIEALACGCGVIASRVSGVEDYEANPLSKHCLWVRDIGDARGMADSVIAAAGVPSAQRVRAARTLAESEFSIERCVDRYSDLIEKIATDRCSAVERSTVRSRLISLVSFPVAAERRLRLWASGR